MIKILREHRRLQQSLTHCHYNHLSASHKEATCHIIGRCVKSFLFQLGTKAPSSLFLPYLFFNQIFISVSPGCPALLRCMVLHETYDNVSWLASSHSNYGCLLLWWTPHSCNQTSLSFLHMCERLCSKKPTFRQEGLLEYTHTDLKPHSTSIHIEICINGPQWIKEKSAFGQNNLCLKPVPVAIWPKKQCRSGQKVIDDGPDDLSFHCSILTNFFEPFRAL